MMGRTPMDLLALDVGSSSIKAALLRNGRVTGRVARATFPTGYSAVTAEVDARALLGALAEAAGQLGRSTLARVEAVVMSNMAASWIAMDRRGRALTPIVTHQDRRSVAEAMELERRVGQARYLSIAGSRPFPGGISSTTWLWFRRHAPELVKRIDLVGHVNTLLLRVLCGARVTDPSNASFMGLYRTSDLGGWSDELCDAADVPRHVLPEVRQGNAVAGRLNAEGARRLRLAQGTPVVAGVVDGSAGMLAAGARVGQLMNVSGSTDVLALCTNRPRPHERLLTRALGVRGLWVAVSTIAAAGSSLDWARAQLFADLTDAAFWKRVSVLVHRVRGDRTRDVHFEPYLAGDRMSVQQRRGAFCGLTLASTRDDMLKSVAEALASASAARLPILKQVGVRMRREVIVTGGVQKALHRLLHRDWPGDWRFRYLSEATVRGLAELAPTI